MALAVPSRLGNRVVAASVLALPSLATSSARAEDQTASAGAVEATFSFSASEPFSGAAAMWLAIDRDGAAVYDDEPDVGECDASGTCGPAGYQRDSVRVRDLDGDGEPEVLLDLYWGGAHCCFFANVYRYDGTGYESVSHNFADTGYRVWRERGAVPRKVLLIDQCALHEGGSRTGTVTRFGRVVWRRVSGVGTVGRSPDGFSCPRPP